MRFSFIMINYSKPDCLLFTDDINDGNGQVKGNNRKRRKSTPARQPRAKKQKEEEEDLSLGEEDDGLEQGDGEGGPGNTENKEKR